MSFDLIVTEPFGTFKRGVRITDPDAVRRYGASHPAHVVRVASHPVAPAPAPEPVKIEAKPDAEPKAP